MTRAALVAGLLLEAGCFFTGGIDSPPEAAIRKLTPGSVHYPGETLEFDATKSRGSRAGWRTARCQRDAQMAITNCVPITALDASDVALDDPYQVPIEDHDPLEVQLTVIDDGGARAVDVFEVEPGDRAPTLAVQVHQGAQAPSGTTAYVVTVPLDVVAVAGDPDLGDTAGLGLTWTLERAPGSDQAQVVWQPLAADTYQLIPDVAGVWHVDLTADDGFGGTTTISEPIVVADDAAPCIVETSPASVDGAHYVALYGGPLRRFAVQSVSDDLDPYPPLDDASPYGGVASFRWSLASPATGGALAELSGHQTADYVVDPSAYGPGDSLTLRVEALDRVTRAPTCAPEAPTCGPPSCRSRLTWEVDVR